MSSVDSKKNILDEMDDLIKKRIYSNGVSTMTEDLRKKFISIAESCMDLTIATTREDGWPQANTVGFVNIDEDIYVETFKTTSKAKNIARDPRVSLTIAPFYEDVTKTVGISMAAIAEVVTDKKIIDEFHRRLLKKMPQIAETTYPDGTKVFPDYENTVIYHFRPVVASILDFDMGFGAADFVVYDEADNK